MQIRQLDNSEFLTFFDLIAQYLQESTPRIAQHVETLLENEAYFPHLMSTAEFAQGRITVVFCFPSLEFVRMANAILAKNECWFIERLALFAKPIDQLAV